MPHKDPERRAEYQREYSRKKRGYAPWGSPEHRAKLSAASTARMSDPTVLSRVSATWTGDKNPSWKGDSVGYSALHNRIYKTLGKASEHPCVDCGQVAQEWSLSWQRVPSSQLKQQVGGPWDGLFYSTDVYDYDPRCIRDARRYDKDFVREAI